MLAIYMSVTLISSLGNFETSGADVAIASFVFMICDHFESSNHPPLKKCVKSPNRRHSQLNAVIGSNVVGATIGRNIGRGIKTISFAKYLSWIDLFDFLNQFDCQINKQKLSTYLDFDCLIKLRYKISHSKKKYKMNVELTIDNMQMTIFYEESSERVAII